MINQDFLQTLATAKGVSNLELDVVVLAMDGDSTPAIAKKLNVSEDTVRKRLSEVYRKFQIPGSGPVKLTKLQQILVSQYQQYLSQSYSDLPNHLPSDGQQDINLHHIWNGAPDVSAFYGRTEELATLEKWIVRDRCRIVALLGMGGIGKTYLSVKLARQIQERFEYIIWQSLHQAPTIQDVLANLITILSQPQKIDLPEALDQRVSLLIKYLREKHCLLVLDAVEIVLDSSTVFWRYHNESEGYGILLRRLGEEQHQSCLLMTSIEKPREIALLESSTGCVRALELKGLKPEAAQKILQSKSLTGEQQWSTLIQTYRGNPLALKIVATTIQEVFSCNVDEFLKYEFLVVSDMFREILDWQFKRLSNAEKEIMYYLAKQNNLVSVQNLQQAMQNSITTSELIVALESLGGRSLLEKVQSEDKNTSETLFSLQPVVRNYVNKLIPVSKRLNEDKKRA
ncbi:NB-ARC domain-containing protein [Nostoc sp. FACHB-110]|uniref:NB-ARC domain-containing protein n=1 Tax=Nostoc sp. FACHB-110 TaxID=2692834 RepID=UPI001689C86D|nr:NB-ARC domain-containing protein [Nostoc sp. FACHB-110]MBD2438077.1 LuxR family transcriptional regulator [Nostoc sp. FACHB-110]